MARSRQDDAHDHRIDFLLSQVGELKGTTAAMNQSLTQLTGDLARMQGDVNTKHQENLRVLGEHTKDDERRFDRANRVIYGAVGAIALLEFILRFMK